MLNRADRHLGDASTIKRLVSTVADDIAATRHADIPLRLIGVRTRGVPLADRLAAELHSRTGTEVPVGAVDITLYRDDLGRSQTWPVLHGTEIPFSIEGADVVLVDDVLFTGRTIRAALNAICDLGRPASVRLAVLVDRGHRELPIRADFVGLQVTTDRADHVRVRLRPVDPVDEIVADGTGIDTTPPARPAPDDARPKP